MDAPGAVAAQKAHRPSRSKAKKTTNTGTGGKKNAVAKPGAFARRVRLAADRSEKRATNPVAPVDRTRGDAAPRVCAVVGPSGVGKSTIIRNLVKHYSKRNIPSITGPITLVSGCKKRLTLLEVGADLASMIDAAKVADLVLLVVDAAFGFEMETFEFLHILSAHGMPKVITVLTHLDKLRDGRQVRKAKKAFKDRIWAELYDGAKVFYLSGITTTGDYLSREVLNLARFISVSKFPVLRWRAEHPYILADRVEDITPQSVDENANRTVAAYGYVRGTPLRTAQGEWRLHLAGVADLIATNIEPLPDPCPPPQSAAQMAASASTDADGQQKRRKVSERERILYAPMAPEVDGIAYDRDAVYIDLNPRNIRFSEKSALVTNAASNDITADSDDDEENDDEEYESSDGEGEKMVKTLQKSDNMTVDDSLKRAELQLVEGGKPLISENFEPRQRRRAVFDTDDDGGDEPEDNSEEEDDASDDDDDDGTLLVTGNRVARKKGKTSDAETVDAPSEEEEEDYSDDDNESIDRDEDGDADNEDDDDDDDDDPNEYASMRWKDLMRRNAERNFKSAASASKALAKYVYEKDENGEYRSSSSGEDGLRSDGVVDEEDEEDAFFRPRRKRAPAGKEDELISIPNFAFDDITRLLPDSVRDWVSNESLCARLKRKRWGTGQSTREENGEEDTGENSDAEDDDDEDEVDGDFEDLETGEVHKANQSKNEENGERADDEDDSDMEAIQAEKIRRKEEFDANWDRNGRRRGKGNTSDDDEENRGSSSQGQPDVRSRKAMRGEAEREPDFRKLERERAEKLKEAELGHMDLESRIALEGVLPGQYVRLELQNVPVEFVRYFDPNLPLVLGGLRQADDEGETYIRARIRRNRFKRGVLKSSDPVIFSVGWRRFQSLPVYDTEDVNRRRRFLKYTPEHLHCNATFWGAAVAPGAGIVMCQTLARERGAFRIAANGVVTEVHDGSGAKQNGKQDAEGKTVMNIVKKLKLIGEAVKVHRNTAFIKGMFNSELEACKYIGAAIRTVSGVRGTVKKAISENAQRGGLDRAVAKAPPGTFRAGFEDKILLSDIVFLRAWVPVPVEKFCTIAATMLQRDGHRVKDGESTWKMRTVRQVREAKGMAIPLKQDSLYKEVERGTPVFAPLNIPKRIEAALPYASKQKRTAPITSNGISRTQRGKLAQGDGRAMRKVQVNKERVVVTDASERKERQLLQAVYNIRKERAVKKKETKKVKLDEKVRMLKREEEKHAKTSRELKKRKFAIEGARDARNAKRTRKGGGSSSGDGGDGIDE